MITFPYRSDYMGFTNPLNLEDVKKAIDFIETLDEHLFVRGYQMFEAIDMNNNLEPAKHCVLGALALLPTSPFYDITQIELSHRFKTDLYVVNRFVASNAHVVNTLNYLVKEVFGSSLARFNNGIEPEGLEGESTPKNRALTALKQTYEILKAQPVE